MSTPGKEAVSAAKAAGLTDREKEILFKSWKCLKSFPEVSHHISYRISSTHI